jgi:hypothetical protein
MAGELPKDDKDVKLEEYELLADGWVDPATKKRFKRGDTVKVDTEHAVTLVKLGSLGKKGTVKESEESDKTVAEKQELHQRIHMGLVDPGEKDEESDSADEAKGSGSVNVKRTPAK